MRARCGGFVSSCASTREGRPAGPPEFPDNAPDILKIFLFTDLAGSSALWEAHPDRMDQALALHDARSRVAVESNSGRVVKMTGDGLHAIFPSAMSACLAASRIHADLLAISTACDVTLRARAGVHAGESIERDGDHFGPDVNRAARIMSVAHGGQTLVSWAASAGLPERPEVAWSLRDLGQVPLKGFTRAEHIFQFEYPGLEHAFPSLAAVRRAAGNIGADPTTFFGREAEMLQLSRLLESERLVTLSGLGGLGKSRLARRFAGSVKDRFPDGAWVVEFGRLDKAMSGWSALAAALGLRGAEGAEDARAAVVEHIRAWRALVVLDNCETHVETCALLCARLLAECPGMRMIATSRRALGIDGEVVVALRTLPPPHPRLGLALDELARYDAVRLFVDRANRASPGFALTPGNAARIVEICHRLDGIPLAIELAAARLRAIPLEVLDDEVSRRLHWTESASRDAIQDETIGDSIQWSYDLLGAPARDLFRRFAVFVGGADFAALRDVAGEGRAADLPSVLTTVCDTSLLRMENGRYECLEVVRQFALGRLAESGEADAVRSVHLATFARFTEDAARGMQGRDQAAWLQRMDVEHGNLLAALDWSLRSRASAVEAIKLLRGLKFFWIRRGNLTAGYERARPILNLFDATEKSAELHLAHFHLGQICYFLGRYPQAREHFEASLGIARAIGPRRRLAAVLQPLGLACIGSNDESNARIYLEEALHLARQEESAREIAAASIALGQAARVAGRLAQAKALYGDGRVHALAADDVEAVAIADLNLAMVAIEEGDLATARGHAVEAIRVAKQTGSRPLMQSAVELSAILVAKQQPRLAVRLLGAVEQEMLQSGFQRDPADARFLVPWQRRLESWIGAAAYGAELEAGRLISVEAALASTGPHQ